MPAAEISVDHEGIVEVVFPLPPSTNSGSPRTRFCRWRGCSLIVTLADAPVERRAPRWHIVQTPSKTLPIPFAKHRLAAAKGDGSVVSRTSRTTCLSLRKSPRDFFLGGGGDGGRRTGRGNDDECQDWGSRGPCGRNPRRFKVMAAGKRAIASCWCHALR